MNKKIKDNIYIYTINKDDLIMKYSKNFQEFAHTNDWSSEIMPEDVIGKSIFDFIDGATVKHLYEILFEHCRKGKHIGPIPFRCDSPSRRRYLNLYLGPLPHSSIDIKSEVVKIESRAAVKALMSNIPRTEEFIRICSMCKKIDVSKNEWMDIEEGLIRLNFFEKNDPPQLTHGLCEDCFAIAMSQLKEELNT